jgi:cation transport ATPase
LISLDFCRSKQTEKRTRFPVDSRFKAHSVSTHHNDFSTPALHPHDRCNCCSWSECGRSCSTPRVKLQLCLSLPCCCPADWHFVDYVPQGMRSVHQRAAMQQCRQQCRQSAQRCRSTAERRWKELRHRLLHLWKKLRHWLIHSSTLMARPLAVCWPTMQTWMMSHLLRLCSATLAMSLALETSLKLLKRRSLSWMTSIALRTAVLIWLLYTSAHRTCNWYSDSSSNPVENVNFNECGSSNGLTYQTVHFAAVRLELTGINS